MTRPPIAINLSSIAQQIVLCQNPLVRTLTLQSYFADGQPVRLASWRRRGGFPAHAHEFPEIVLITGGHGVQERHGGSDALVSGDILLLRAGDWHAYHHDGALAGIDCAIHPDLLQRELAWTAADPRLGPLLWGRRRTAGACRLRPAAAGACTTLFASPPPGTGRAGWIGRLLVILDAVGAMLPGPGIAIHPAAAEAARLMEGDPARPWTLTGLALRVGLRPAYLCRVFARDFGVPPRDWLLHRRVQTAQQSLLAADRTIQDIATSAGWRDAAVFSRFFRRATGLSPRLWRRRFATGESRRGL